MKASILTALVLVLLSGGLIGLWLALRDEPIATATLDPESAAPAEERKVAAARAVEPSDDESEVADVPASPFARVEILPAEPVGASGATDAGPAAIVHGRLRDDYTGEALPDFLLVVRDAAGHREEVSTDAQGNFATATKLVPGTLSISFPDRPGRAAGAESQKIQHLSESQELDLSVACGPTFWLDVQPAREIEIADLEARLYFMGRDGRGASDPEPVRTGEGAWIRFGPIDGVNGELLEVVSRGGHWRGRARVHELHGRVPAIVPVRLSACAVLKVHAAALDGSAIEGADLFVTWTNSAGKPGKSQGRSDADGVFTFKYLAAGDVQLAARSLFHAPADDVPVHLVERQTSSAEVVMERLAAAGAIRGRITSDTARYAAKVEVILSPPASASTNGKAPNPWRTTPEWRIIDGRSVGVFSFEGLPKERYRIDLSHKDDFFRWEPQRLELEPPNESALFRVHDAVPNGGIAFRVRDGDNGLLLDGLHVTLDIRGGPSRILSASSNQVLYTHLPYDRKIAWRVDREEYQPAFGDDSSFITEELRGDEKVRCAEVNLDPGWGDVFRVAFGQKNGGTPIEGAHILLDGREGGVTGKNGTVRVFAKRKPAHVACTYKDWNVAGKIDLSPPWARSDRNFIRVEMRPPSKKSPAK